MNLLKAMSTVSAMTLLSRITGLARESLKAVIFGAGLQMEIMRGAVPEIFEVLVVEIAQLQRHAEIGGLDSWHCSVSPMLSRAA